MPDFGVRRGLAIFGFVLGGCNAVFGLAEPQQSNASSSVSSSPSTTASSSSASGGIGGAMTASGTSIGGAGGAGGGSGGGTFTTLSINGSFEDWADPNACPSPWNCFNMTVARIGGAKEGKYAIRLTAQNGMVAEIAIGNVPAVAGGCVRARAWGRTVGTPFLGVSAAIHVRDSKSDDIGPFKPITLAMDWTDSQYGYWTSKMADTVAVRFVYSDFPDDNAPSSFDFDAIEIATSPGPCPK